MSFLRQNRISEDSKAHEESSDESGEEELEDGNTQRRSSTQASKRASAIGNNDDADDEEDEEDEESGEEEEDDEGTDQHVSSRQGKEGEPSTEDPKTRLAQLMNQAPVRPLGPTELMIISGNEQFAKSFYPAALNYYRRAMTMVQTSGKHECHEHFLTISLNITETLIRLNDLDAANIILQPALIKLDTNSTSSLQQDSAKRFLLKEGRAWWQSLFPEDKLQKKPSKSKKLKKKKKKNQSPIKT